MAASKTGNGVPTFPVPSGISTVRIVVQTNQKVSLLDAIASDSNFSLNRMKQWFRALVLGAYRSNVDVNSGGVNAVGTITLSSFVAADTVTVNGTVLTGSATPSGIAQFLVGANDTATAVNLAACINAHTSLYGTVYATSSGAVVTITCRVPGLIGNLCTLAISAHGSRSAATLASGADGNESVVAHGL